jgi:hypothetical protein
MIGFLPLSMRIFLSCKSGKKPKKTNGVKLPVFGKPTIRRALVSKLSNADFDNKFIAPKIRIIV